MLTEPGQEVITSRDVEMFIQPDMNTEGTEANALGYDTFHPSRGQTTQGWNSKDSLPALPTVPQTEGYKHWQQELNLKLKGSDRKDRPRMSAGSRLIMENKR
jgi:hypothetical protein